MKISIILAAIATLAFSTTALAQTAVDLAEYDYMQKDYNYRRAIELRNNRDSEESLNSLNKSLAENPHSARTLCALGDYYQLVQLDLSSAERYYKKAVDEAGKDISCKAKALTQLSYIYSHSDGKQTQAYQTAREAVELCEKMSPKSADGYVYMAIAYAQDDDYEGAAIYYRRALRIAPFNAYCWNNLCYALIKIGTPEALKEAEQAIADAQKVGVSFTDDSQGCELQEQLAFKTGDYARCAQVAIAALARFRSIYGSDASRHLAMLDSASAHNPTAVRLMLEAKMNAEPLITKWPEIQGRICDSRKDYDNAIAAYRKAYDVDSSTVDYLYYIATAQSQKCDYDGTVKTCDAIIARDTAYAQIYSLRAGANERLDRKATILADYDKAISIHPTHAFYYYRRAWFERYNGMLNEAALDMTTAIQLNSDYSHYYLTRANILEALGETDMAKDDYQAIIDLTTRNIRSYTDFKPEEGGLVIKDEFKNDAAEDYAQRAYAHFYLGDPDAATSDMDLAAELDPDKDGAYYNCACLYSLMGQTDKAVGYLRKAVDAGYYEDVHMIRDTDLDNIRNTEGYKACLADAKAHREAQAGTTSHLAKSAPADDNADQPDVIEVPFTRDGGVLVVSCTVNGLPLNYIFDSGASNVCISLSEAQFMLKNGYLDKKDLGGKEYYGDATGRVSEGMSINLKTLTFGGLTIRNVKASVTSTLNAPLLLGQTAMQMLGNVHIDYDKGVVRITKRAK